MRDPLGGPNSTRDRTMQSDLKDAVSSAIKTLPPDDRSDVYALSFFIYDEEDDPRIPTLTLGYNTTAKWQSSVSEASSSAEAKWNYAFWLQNTVLQFGHSHTPSFPLVREWIESLSLSYTDQEEDDDFERCLELGYRITSHFVEGAVAVASDLHSTSILQDTFGRPVPILVHSLEYHDQIANQNRRANPGGTADEFIAWVESL